ncbi:MAG: SIS domain-containing protein [Clostridia bacterium]|nr:SIS domain-containing protein [Clostridia bacterium]
MNTDTIFRKNIDSLRNSLATLPEEHILNAVKCIEATRDVIANGGKVLLAGNGGSASTASHITNDFIGHMTNWNRRSYPAIALTADISVLTALTNDYGYDRVFARQIEGLGNKGDIFWGLSTSGNSKNILLAIEECKRKGIITVGFTARDGGKMKDLVDIWVPANTNECMIAEAYHLFYFHSIAESVEALLDPMEQ